MKRGTMLLGICAIGVVTAGLSMKAWAEDPQPAAPAAAPAPSTMTDKDAERLFATTCGWCHQKGGREQGRGPKLQDTARSDEFIIERIKNGKPGAMPSFRNTLNDDKIQGILHYIRNLKDN